MDKNTPIADSITVSVQPDDFNEPYQAACEGEPCDSASYLPNEAPTIEPGTTFEPFTVPDCELTIPSLSVSLL